MPLRPLGLGDLYDAAFKTIRYNPAATVGSAVLVTAIAMTIPVLVTTAVSASVDLPSFAPGSAAPSGGELVGLVASMGSLFLGLVLQSIGLVLVTGMVAHVVMAATLGRRVGLGEAWAATHGQRWRLIGLTLLLGLLTFALIAVFALAWVPAVMLLEGWQVFLFGLVAVPLFLAVMLLFWVRVYYLSVPALMLENLGVVRSMGRARELTARTFWRTFGIALLTIVITQLAGALLSAPVSIAAQAATSMGGVDPNSVLLLVLTQAASSVVAAAFVAPFATAVACLQYVDLRIRKEGFDVELLTRAGLPRP